ncbi:MAG: nucleotidyltransferase family protein [Chloroflexota bacterium]
MIAAIVLAAGQSKRMGQPKMPLPWGKTTVLGQVIATLQGAGAGRIIVVTGGAREAVEALVARYASVSRGSLSTVFNQRYASGEMLSSVQAGLLELAGAGNPSAEAALIAPGDQPQVQERSVRLVVQAYLRSQAPIVIPSFQMRRGHPWLVGRVHWQEILRMRPPDSLRDFLNRHADEIRYVQVDDPGVLQDLDTSEDYLKSRP